MTRRWKRFSHCRCVSKYCVEWKLELADMQALFRFIVTLCKLPLKTVFTAKLFLTGFFIDLFHSAIGQISDETVMYFDRLNFLTIYFVFVAH